MHSTPTEEHFLPLLVEDVSLCGEVLEKSFTAGAWSSRLSLCILSGPIFAGLGREVQKDQRMFQALIDHFRDASKRASDQSQELMPLLDSMQLGLGDRFDAGGLAPVSGFRRTFEDIRETAEPYEGHGDHAEMSRELLQAFRSQVAKGDFSFRERQVCMELGVDGGQRLHAALHGLGFSAALEPMSSGFGPLRGEHVDLFKAADVLDVST